MGDDKPKPWSWLESFRKSASKGSKEFVAFFFFLLTIGIVFGIVVQRIEPTLLLLPPLFGVVAYYNEKISVLLFVALIVFLV